MKHLLSAADLTREDATAILDNADRFYCSELVAWALGVRDTVYADDILVTPAELEEVGPTIYASADRGDLPTAQVDPYWQ